jgi:hypothetical protein
MEIDRIILIGLKLKGIFVEFMAAPRAFIDREWCLFGFTVLVVGSVLDLLKTIKCPIRTQTD